MQRILVGFGDADAFYSSAEVVRRPWLKGVPLGVLGNQGACVIARSYSMKRFGVKVGEPIWEAREKCPEGVYVKRDFRWYESLSRRMLAEIGMFSRTVEYHSIDEFFWRHEPSSGEHPADAAVAIRDRIKRIVGVPMTVAIARTRTLAKLFADASKPFGAVAVLNPQEERELLATLPVTEIAGIARRRAARLEPHGIRTCLDFAEASGLLVQKQLRRQDIEPGKSNCHIANSRHTTLAILVPSKGMNEPVGNQSNPRPWSIEESRGDPKCQMSHYRLAEPVPP